mgnify:CR=1 FL=1
MKKNNPVLDAQREHWERMLGQKPEMFGLAPSAAAYKAAEIFAREGSGRILELGAGQGRDTVLFAEKEFAIVALDYAQSGLRSIRQKSQASSHSQSVHVLRHDVRDPLSFRDESFDACYSHMLYCMALKLKELEFISAEIWRVLRPGGINIYNRKEYGGLGLRKGYPSRRGSIRGGRLHCAIFQPRKSVAPCERLGNLGNRLVRGR